MPSEDLLALWREVESRLDALLTSLDGRLGRDGAAVARDYLGHNEFGLALGAIADSLSEVQTPITDRERVEMLALNERMAMDDRVPEALARCPGSA